jgi:glycosyltransferase involved in cell wall biosynthesis
MADGSRVERGSRLSLILPAYDEEKAIAQVLGEARETLDAQAIEYEIIVVDDESDDETARIAEECGATVLRNVQRGGYGYSLMRGIRQARFPTIAILDADGSYPVAALPALLDAYRRGFSMAVAERRGGDYASSARIRLLRGLFRLLAEFIVGRRVPDVNSGMRVFDRSAVLPLLPHMSYGFSFTTSITLLFMMRALPVTYVPIEFRKRAGRSKVRYLRDSLRALQIVASITARLNPVKLFLLAALLNLLGMAPVLWVMSWWGEVGVPIVLVLETSVLLVALGLLVEALISKPPFPSDHDEDGER